MCRSVGDQSSIAPTLSQKKTIYVYVASRFDTRTAKKTEPYLLNSRIIRKNISMDHMESEVTEATTPLIQRLL